MLNNLPKFYTDPDWHIVEDILVECFKDIYKEPEESLAPADFKAQVLANKKLQDSVSNFLESAKLTSRLKNKSKNPFE